VDLPYIPTGIDADRLLAERLTASTNDNLTTSTFKSA
jgi:hypothetical protein